MSVSIGSSGSAMGPRSAIREFGSRTGRGGLNWRTIVRLLGYLRPHWQRMLAAFFMILVSSGLTLAAPYLIKVAIDQYIAAGDAQGLTEISFALAGVFLAIFITQIVMQYLLTWVGQKVLA